MRIFVTGATGYVGRAVSQSLLRDGHEVIALVRSRARGAELEQRGAQLAVADISDVDRVFPPGSRAIDKARRLLGFEPRCDDPMAAILTTYAGRALAGQA